MSMIEDRNDCPPVERFIWDQVGKDWGDFGGVKQMSMADLLHMRSLCDHQMRLITGDGQTTEDDRLGN